MTKKEVLEFFIVAFIIVTSLLIGARLMTMLFMHIGLF